MDLTSHCLFFFFIVFFFFSSKPSLSLTLLSLNCKSSSSSSIQNYQINPILTLLHNLAIKAPNSFTTSNTTFELQHYTGFMQCRPGLGLYECSLCTNRTRSIITTLCPNSTAISVWFGGCYLRISPTNSSTLTNISTHSCSGRANSTDQARFLPALETLLLKLRADVNIPTRHGFSHGQIAYETSNGIDRQIYGLVECVRSVSIPECDDCIQRAAEKLQVYCGAGNAARGFAIGEVCIVQFGGNEFEFELEERGRRAGGGLGRVNNAGEYLEVDDEEKSWRRRAEVVAYWGGGVGGLGVVVVLAWALRKAVLKRGKVGVLDSCEAAAAKTSTDRI